MGVELELIVLLVVSVLGSGIFAVFEVETPAWRKVLKWFIVIGATLWLYTGVGHWAIALPIFAAAAGAAFHFWWCGKNGINPLTAEPRRRYYELRGWKWRE